MLKLQKEIEIWSILKPNFERRERTKKQGTSDKSFKRIFSHANVVFLGSLHDYGKTNRSIIEILSASYS